jgi:hypothetical protein
VRARDTEITRGTALEGRGEVRVRDKGKTTIGETKIAHQVIYMLSIGIRHRRPFNL